MEYKLLEKQDLEFMKDIIEDDDMEFDLNNLNNFLKDSNNQEIIEGKIIKQQNKMTNLFVLMFVFTILIIVICGYRGKNILSPFIYLRREITNYQYGYNTTILKTDNQYFNENINNLEEANFKI